MMNIRQKTTIEDTINKKQQLKGKTKPKFQMKNMRQAITYQFKEDPFSKRAQGIALIMQEVKVLLKFLQTKPQAKNKNVNYYDFFYTIIKKYIR